MLDNLILSTDSYKLGHWPMYPDKMTGLFSYFESRTGATFDFTQWWGLQGILIPLCGPVITAEMIEEAAEVVAVHMGDADLFNRAGWEHILHDHGGHLPLRIKAAPEGMCIPVSNVMMTVENTCPRCFWLTNYMESLLTHVWYPSTVATQSKHIRNMLEHYTAQSGDPDMVNLMLQDFGYRGATCDEAAAIGGAGHLINFKGTDTLKAMEFVHRFYGAKWTDLAYSVPASEHSIMTSEGRDGEYRVLDRLLDEFPTGILSVVIDSYDTYAFIDAVIERRDRIAARDGIFVVRPDSTTDQHTTPHGLTAEIMRRLAAGFGSTKNDKGYALIDGNVRVLWGDGIDYQQMRQICDHVQRAGFSINNMACFGMGGGLLQRVNRDTQRFAFKASAIQIDEGEWTPVRKETPNKASKAGRLVLVRDAATGEYNTVVEGADMRGTQVEVLEDVFEDGVLKRRHTFDEVRANALAA